MPVAQRTPKHKTTSAEPTAALADEGAAFIAYVVETHPFAAGAAARAWADAGGAGPEAVIAALDEEIARGRPSGPLPETTPFVPAAERFDDERARLRRDVAGHFERRALASSITPAEQRWMLAGVVLTRAVDNRMKQLFLSSEMRYGELGFQGKGFRSLGQEAIYAAALRLQRGATLGDGVERGAAGWRGDVVGPLIRDLGVTLAFCGDTDAGLEMALNAQVGKAGPPSDGRDLHLGMPERGVVMVAAPLSIATCTLTGYALAFQKKAEARVAVSFIGEGGSSLGEWHEAINLAAVRRLPMVFCVENNQTALSTRVAEQSRVRTFGDKALGYGIPHVTVDGTDAFAIAAAFAWAAQRARKGEGPALVETVAMRMCGHAHHDDMLYLGGDPPLSFELPPTPDKGYVDRERYTRWATRDPLARLAAQLVRDGVVSAGDVDDMKADALARIDRAVGVLKARPWPSAELARRGVFSDGATVPAIDTAAVPALPRDVDVDVAVEPAPPFHPKGQTFLDAIGLGLGDVLARVPEAFVLGEDVGPPYGNAFLLLKPLVDKYGDRLLNTPIAEGAIIGACVGAALAGLRPIGEIQFNDFVASGFNQLVNNAAKLHFRAGTRVPMTLRLPWGGLRRAGPYHSQDTAPWFFRTPGLKIVVPSTPHDARALMMSAVVDDDPVLVYEHIALYRDPKIKQALPSEPPAPLPIGVAAFRRLGKDVHAGSAAGVADLSLISYGAYVHKALAVAERLAAHGVECDVLDLRSLAPLDWPRIAATVRRTGKVLLVGEDSRTGSILESIAARISESLFLSLDAPVRVLGALDTPVPYSPSLEDAFLLSEAQIEAAALSLARF